MCLRGRGGARKWGGREVESGEAAYVALISIASRTTSFVLDNPIIDT